MKLTGSCPALLLALMCTACGNDPAVQGLPEVALEDLERPLADLLQEHSSAVRSAPESADAWGTLALAFDAHAFADEALECYRRAEALDPRDFR